MLGHHRRHPCRTVQNQHISRLSWQRTKSQESWGHTATRAVLSWSRDLWFEMLRLISPKLASEQYVLHGGIWQMTWLPSSATLWSRKSANVSRIRPRLTWVRGLSDNLWVSNSNFQCYEYLSSHTNWNSYAESRWHY
jgi:hypothetical protein